MSSSGNLSDNLPSDQQHSLRPTQQHQQTIEPIQASLPQNTHQETESTVPGEGSLGLAASHPANSKHLVVAFSTGDLGDVGRHVVAAALAERDAVSLVTVISNNITSLYEPNWKCSCPEPHNIQELFAQKIEDDPHQQAAGGRYRGRLQLIHCDFTDRNAAQIIDAVFHQGVDAIIACLGNRKPFHNDRIAGIGTEQLIDAITRQGKRKRSAPRMVLLSSAGIGDDWPPMEWSRSGDRLQAFFRTICWQQYQDLSRAERVLLAYAQSDRDFDYLIARSVLLGEQTRPTGQWYVQKSKHRDHPLDEVAKSDIASFLVHECLSPSFNRTAVVLGGKPNDLRCA